jgi:autotransporter strand-loop-strand O-heptosyltransferase
VNKIFDNEKYKENLLGKVLINFDSKSLGDNIAWMPYAEEFRKKHNCKVVLSTFWNHLFEKEYPEIEFISPGTVVYNINGQYNIGWYFPWDPNKNPNDFRTISLQQTASDILGLEYKEIKPKITIP